METTPLSAGLAAISEACSTDERGPLIAAKCRALLRGYDARWRSSGYVPLSVEETQTAPLTNPATGRDSRTFRLAGKKDVVCLYAERRYVFDGKTTSENILDPAGPYWRQLVIEGQVSQYMLLEWLNGTKADGAVWDVCHKPQISPKKITKAERTSVVAGGEYYGVRISDDDRQQLVADERETLAMYEARLTHDCTVERPDHYFQRRAVPRLDSELLEYAGEVWDHGQDILNVRQTGRNPRNSGACMAWGSPCRFLGICSGHDTPDSEKWQRKVFVHNELPAALGGDGRDLLTNSRIRCFQTCRRKHHYEYELGIERQDEEEREALFFGNVWHAGLAAWWSAQIPQENENGDCPSESPANSVGNYTGSEARIAR